MQISQPDEPHSSSTCNSPPARCSESQHPSSELHSENSLKDFHRNNESKKCPLTLARITKEAKEENSSTLDRGSLKSVQSEYSHFGQMKYPAKLERFILSSLFIERYLRYAANVHLHDSSGQQHTIVDPSRTILHDTWAEQLSFSVKLISKICYEGRSVYLETRAQRWMLAVLDQFCEMYEHPSRSPPPQEELRLWKRYTSLLTEQDHPTHAKTPREHIAYGLRTAVRLQWALFENLPHLFESQSGRSPTRHEIAHLYRQTPIFLRSLAATSMEILTAVDAEIVIRVPLGGTRVFGGLRSETLQLDRSTGIISIKEEILDRIQSNRPSQSTQIIGCPVLASVIAYNTSTQLQIEAAIKHLAPLLDQHGAAKFLRHGKDAATWVARQYSSAFDATFNFIDRRLS